MIGNSLNTNKKSALSWSSNKTRGDGWFRAYASGEKKWLSSPDANQECFHGCLTTLFSPEIITIRIWTYYVAWQGWWKRIRNVAFASYHSSFGAPEVRSYTNCLSLHIWYIKRPSFVHSQSYKNRRTLFRVWKNIRTPECYGHIMEIVCSPPAARHYYVWLILKTRHTIARNRPDVGTIRRTIFKYIFSYESGSALSVKRSKDAPSKALICANHAFRGSKISSQASFRHIPAFRGRELYSNSFCSAMQFPKLAICRMSFHSKSAW